MVCLCDRPAPEVVFTRHPEGKFEVLERYGFRVTRAHVIDVLLKKVNLIRSLLQEEWRDG